MASWAPDVVNHQAGLPRGWTLRVTERSANVWEVVAVDPAGRAASATDSDLETATAKAVEGATSIQRQLDDRK